MSGTLSLPPGFASVGDQAQCLTCKVLIQLDEIARHAATHATAGNSSAVPVSAGSFIVSSSDARPPSQSSNLVSSLGSGLSLPMEIPPQPYAGAQQMPKSNVTLGRPPNAAAAPTVVPPSEMQLLRPEFLAAINNRDSHRLSQLIVAYKNRYPGANIDDIRDPADGATLLHRASSQMGNDEMCHLLLAAGACPHNGRWSDGNTPMHEAASCNRATILSVYLGISQNHCHDLNKRGVSVIQLARERGAAACEQLLLEHMARVGGPPANSSPPPVKLSGVTDLFGGMGQRSNSGGMMMSRGMPSSYSPNGPAPSQLGSANSFPMGPSRGPPPNFAASPQPLGSYQAMPPPRTMPTQPGFYGAPMPQNIAPAPLAGSPASSTVATTTAAMQRRTALERLPCEATRLFTTASLEAVQGRQTIEKMLRESSQHYVCSWRAAPTILGMSPENTPIRLVVVALRITEVVSDRFIARHDALKQLQAFLRGLDQVVEGSNRDGYRALPSQPLHFSDLQYVYGPLTVGFTVRFSTTLWDTLTSYVYCDTYQKVLRNALIELEYDSCRGTEEGRRSTLEKAYREVAKRLDKPEAFGYVAESAFESLRATFPALLTHAAYDEDSSSRRFVVLHVHGSVAAEVEQFYDRLTEIVWACDDGGFQLPRLKLSQGGINVAALGKSLAPYIADHPPRFDRLAASILPLAIRQKAYSAAESSLANASEISDVTEPHRARLEPSTVPHNPEVVGDDAKKHLHAFSNAFASHPAAVAAARKGGESDIFSSLNGMSENDSATIDHAGLASILQNLLSREE